MKQQQAQAGGRSGASGGCEVAARWPDERPSARVSSPVLPFLPSFLACFPSLSFLAPHLPSPASVSVSGFVIHPTLLTPWPERLQVWVISADLAVEVLVSSVLGHSWHTPFHLRLVDTNAFSGLVFEVNFKIKYLTTVVR